MSGRGNGADRQAYEVEYRLPASKVRFSGIRTTTSVSYENVTRPARVTTGVQVEIRADYRAEAARTLELPRADNGEVALDLELLEDGRLVSGGATVDPKSDTLWPAVLSNAAMAGAAGAALGPIGAVGGALIGGLGTVLASGAHRTSHDEGVVPAPEVVERATAEDAGVVPAYQEQHNLEAELLIAYRVAIGKLVQQHAALALLSTDYQQAPDAEALCNLEKSILSCGRMAEQSELLYASWLADQVSVTREVVEHEVYLDELPTEAEWREECNDDKFDHNDKRWWPIVKGFHVMVTCDLLPKGDVPLEGARSTRASAAPSGPHICFRQPQPARVMTWKLRTDSHGWFPSQEPELVETSWVLVALKGSERYIPVPNEKSSKSGLSIGIGAAGGLTKIGSQDTSRQVSRISALSGIGGSVSAALGAGQALAGAFSPQAIATTNMTSQAAFNAAKAKLAPPGRVPPDAAREALEAAELAARLAVANQLVSDPASATIIVTAD